MTLPPSGTGIAVCGAKLVLSGTYRSLRVIGPERMLQRDVLSIQNRSELFAEMKFIGRAQQLVKELSLQVNRRDFREAEQLGCAQLSVIYGSAGDEVGHQLRSGVSENLHAKPVTEVGHGVLEGEVAIVQWRFTGI